MEAADNRTIMITGATGGLGRKVALDLASMNASVLVHGRNPEKCRALLEEIQAATGNKKLDFYTTDFSSLEQVRALAEKVISDHDRLDVLINNAGIGPGPVGSGRELSREGYELRFAVNYLSAFVLTNRLLPLLRKSAPSRIVNVASAGQQEIDFDDVMLSRQYDGLRAYCQSKLALVMFTFELAGRLAGTSVAVNCLHPATLMPTTMVMETDYFSGFSDSVEKGADAVEYLAISEEIEGVSGRYFEGKKQARPLGQAFDSQARQRLWDLSMQIADS